MIESKFYEYLKNDTKNSLDVLVCEDAKEAFELRDVALFFERDVVMFPDLRAAYLDDLRSYKEELLSLFDALRSYYVKESKPLVISPLKTLLFPLPKADLLEGFELEFGSKIELKSFKEKMLRWGYSFVDIVQVEGEVSFRGDIFDIFIPSQSHPFRISLFDDEIEEIKPFVTESQRTTGEECESITIFPAFYALDDKSFEEILKEIENTKSDSFVKDIASLGFWYLDTRAENFLEDKKALFIKDMQDSISEAYVLNDPQIPQGLIESLHVIPQAKNHTTLAVTDVPTLLKVHEKKKITLIAINEAQIKAAGIYDTQGLHVREMGIILNIISDDELIISLNKPTKKRRRRKSSIILDDLKPGDYVVHEEYGIGIFKGLTNTRVLGVTRDFVEIVYQGEDKLLLPVENLDSIDR